jgi:hypothetical protein
MDTVPIELENHIVIFQHPLTDAEPEPRPAPASEDLQRAKYERLAALYHNDALIPLMGTKHPAIMEFEGRLDGIVGRPSLEPYTIPSQFRTFAENYIAQRVKARYDISKSGRFPVILRNTAQPGGPVSNPSISVQGWHVDDGRLEVSFRHCSYFDFMGTNTVMDTPIRGNDPDYTGEFPTLREFDIVDGRSTWPRHSYTANLLGAGFVVEAPGPDGLGYLLFPKKRGKMVVMGGTVGMPGGTPEWTTALGKGDLSLAQSLADLVAKELGEELVIRPSEFSINKVYFAQELERAPAPFFEITTSVPVGEITRRMRESPTAREEHETLYAVPILPATLPALVRAGYNVNTMSRVALHRRAAA